LNSFVPDLGKLQNSITIQIGHLVHKALNDNNLSALELLVLVTQIRKFLARSTDDTFVHVDYRSMILETNLIQLLDRALALDPTIE